MIGLGDGAGLLLAQAVDDPERLAEAILHIAEWRRRALMPPATVSGRRRRRERRK